MSHSKYLQPKNIANLVLCSDNVYENQTTIDKVDRKLNYTNKEAIVRQNSENNFKKTNLFDFINKLKTPQRCGNVYDRAYDFNQRSDKDEECKRTKEAQQPVYECIDNKFDRYKVARWYRDIEKEQARNILVNKPNGSFIVRPTTRPNFVCMLTVLHDEFIFNLGIEKDTHDRLTIGSRTAGKKTFDTIDALIHHYMKNKFRLKYNGEMICFKLRTV